MTTELESVIAVIVLGGLLVVAGLGVADATSSGHGIHTVEQTDPISGLHWRRATDPRYPAAPPRLDLVPAPASPAEKTKSSVVCVRAGDRISLQSEKAGSGVLLLQATALASGAPGDHIRARVTVTGAAVEMTILGPGAGALTRKAEAW